MQHWPHAGRSLFTVGIMSPLPLVASVIAGCIASPRECSLLLVSSKRQRCCIVGWCSNTRARCRSLRRADASRCLCLCVRVYADTERMMQ